jgi:hypothetical protein
VLWRTLPAAETERANARLAERDAARMRWLDEKFTTLTSATATATATATASTSRSVAGGIVGGGGGGGVTSTSSEAAAVLE